MNPNNDQPDNGQHHGSGFGVGLVIGTFAGLGAYYLFGTKEGEETRKKLVKEYEKAKKELESNEEFAKATEDLAKAAQKMKKEFDTPQIEEALSSTKGIMGMFKDKMSQYIGDSSTKPMEKPEKKTSNSSRRYFKKK